MLVRDFGSLHLKAVRQAKQGKTQMALAIAALVSVGGELKFASNQAQTGTRKRRGNHRHAANRHASEARRVSFLIRLGLSCVSVYSGRRSEHRCSRSKLASSTDYVTPDST